MKPSEKNRNQSCFQTGPTAGAPRLWCKNMKEQVKIGLVVHHVWWLTWNSTDSTSLLFPFTAVILLWPTNDLLPGLSKVIDERNMNWGWEKWRTLASFRNSASVFEETEAPSLSLRTEMLILPAWVEDLISVSKTQLPKQLLTRSSSSPFISLSEVGRCCHNPWASTIHASRDIEESTASYRDMDVWHGGQEDEPLRTQGS